MAVVGLNAEDERVFERMSREADAAAERPQLGVVIAARDEHAPAMSDDEVLAILRGRPRDDAPRQLASQEWKIRTTPALKISVERAAQSAGVSVSALLRSAALEYLNRHFPDALDERRNAGAERKCG